MACLNTDTSVMFLIVIGRAFHCHSCIAATEKSSRCILHRLQVDAFYIDFKSMHSTLTSSTWSQWVIVVTMGLASTGTGTGDGGEKSKLITICQHAGALIARHRGWRQLAIEDDVSSPSRMTSARHRGWRQLAIEDNDSSPSRMTSRWLTESDQWRQNRY